MVRPVGGLVQLNTAESTCEPTPSLEDLSPTEVAGDQYSSLYAPVTDLFAAIITDPVPVPTQILGFYDSNSKISALFNGTALAECRFSLWVERTGISSSISSTSAQTLTSTSTRTGKQDTSSTTLLTVPSSTLETKTNTNAVSPLPVVHVTVPVL